MSVAWMLIGRACQPSGTGGVSLAVSRGTWREPAEAFAPGRELAAVAGHRGGAAAGVLEGSMSSRCLRLSSFTASSSPAGLHHPGPAGREGWGCKRLHGQLAEGRGSGRPASLSARSLAQCWPAGSILGMSGISGAVPATALPGEPLLPRVKMPAYGFSLPHVNLPRGAARARYSWPGRAGTRRTGRCGVPATRRVIWTSTT